MPTLLLIRPICTLRNLSVVNFVPDIINFFTYLTNTQVSSLILASKIGAYPSGAPIGWH